MTRSDLLIALDKCETKEDYEKIAHIMHNKIEAVYSLLFALESLEDRYNNIAKQITGHLKEG